MLNKFVSTFEEVKFMSQRFFAIILMAIVIFVLLKIVIPMWNFMLRADLAISLYDMLKNLLNDNFQCKKQTEIQLGVYTIRYSNTLEAYEELERVFTDALSYYDKLGFVASKDRSFDEQRDKLECILRKIQWNKQRI